MNDFEVMSEMTKNNQDIAFFPDLIEANKTKGGFKITFGVPEAVGYQIARDMALPSTSTHYTVMYRINREQFDKIKNASK